RGFRFAIRARIRCLLLQRRSPHEYCTFSRASSHNPALAISLYLNMSSSDTAPDLRDT
ncbi:Hypothetical predicted protein, partial [Pelobates cultripes]